MAKIPFMNIKLDNVSLEEAIAAIREAVRRKANMLVFTPNADHMVKLHHNARFLEAYRHAGLVVVDGAPLMLAARIFGTPVKERIMGARLAEAVFEEASKHAWRIYIIGPSLEASELAAWNMDVKYPGFIYAGCYVPPHGFENDRQECMKIADEVNKAHPDVVIAGLGSPKTEIFLDSIREQGGAGVYMSVGAAIEFIAGRVKRCPPWVSKIGMEWFYRFLKEPKRLFRRYFIDDPEFFLLILKYRRGNNSHVT